MSNSSYEDIDFHYIFNDENLHKINAKTLFKAEKTFISYIEFFAKKLELKIDLKISARKEGSFVDIISVASNITGILSLLVALADHFSLPQKKLIKQKMNMKSEEFFVKLKKDIKDEIISKEEAIKFAENDPNLRKLKSDYFSAVKNDSDIKAVKIRENEILRNEFDKRIINKEDESEIDENAEILLSYVGLNQNSKTKMWNGIYGHQNINFYMNDLTYKRKIQSEGIEGGEVVIKCILKKEIDVNFTDKIKYSTKMVLDSWKNEDPEKFSLYIPRKKLSDDQMSFDSFIK